MKEVLPNDPVSLGEGFAFFRWHCFKWSFTSCRGFNDPRSACDTQWMALVRQSQKRDAQTALEKTNGEG